MRYSNRAIKAYRLKIKRRKLRRSRGTWAQALVREVLADMADAPIVRGRSRYKLFAPIL